MGGMPNKNPMTVRRVLTLFLSFVMLCLGGGVAMAGLFVPGVYVANNVARGVVPTLQVDGVDFDVTSLPQKSVMYAADGSKIAEFYVDNREVVPLKEISEPMQKAVVAREDRRFFKHRGVDVQGVFRAFVKTYVLPGGETQGGSSLTQQYVKNVLAMKAREDDDPIAEYHASEQTVARKLREMLIAVQMEKKYSKYEILQGYLNIAQFGNHGIYGVEMAAKRFFNVSAKDLTVGQAATIAAITKNPTKYDPSDENNLEESQKQRNIVLDLMLDQGFINQAQHDEARAVPLKDMLDIQPISSGCQVAGDAAFFCEYATRQILNSDAFGETRAEREKLLKEGGLEIYTTLDVTANSAAMNTARNTIPADDPSGMEVMIAAIQPGTGKVLGFGINRTYDGSDRVKTDSTRVSMNYMVDEVDGGGKGFPVGSTWKPINMVAWMQNGRSINERISVPGTWTSSEFSCDDQTHPYYGGTDTWAPLNSGSRAVNPDSPLEGLVNSRNTTQAAMGAQIKLCSVANAADQLGYHNAATNPETGEPSKVWEDASTYNPTTMIGAVSASPLTMANVYATIAANGVACTPIALTKVVDKSGEELKVPEANCHQAIDPDIAQTTAYAMNQGVLRGQARGGQLDNGRKTFAKTGTNENFTMNAAGFIPNAISAFVVVGDAQNPTQNTFDRKTINGEYHRTWYASYIALPAWKEFMNAYANAAQLPIDNEYGQASERFMKGGGVKKPTTDDENGDGNNANTGNGGNAGTNTGGQGTGTNTGDGNNATTQQPTTPSTPSTPQQPATPPATGDSTTTTPPTQ